jgi:hypothetical protein
MEGLTPEDVDVDQERASRHDLLAPAKKPAARRPADVRPGATNGDQGDAGRGTRGRSGGDRYLTTEELDGARGAAGGKCCDRPGFNQRRFGGLGRAH